MNNSSIYPFYLDFCYEVWFDNGIRRQRFSSTRFWRATCWTAFLSSLIFSEIIFGYVAIKGLTLSPYIVGGMSGIVTVLAGIVTGKEYAHSKAKAQEYLQRSTPTDNLEVPPPARARELVSDGKLKSVLEVKDYLLQEGDAAGDMANAIFKPAGK